MKTINRLMTETQGSYILPFLWLKGEDNDTIKKELDRIEACGIREICVESRPHPDFMGPGWWENVDCLMDEARRRSMRIWMLDDDKFPTGHCNGAFKKKHPELKKTYLAERHVDVMGPCTDSALLVQNFLGSDGELLKILAYQKPDGETLAVSADGVLDLTDTLTDGFIFFSLPKGPYRIEVLFTTQSGGGRDNYMNLIDQDSVRVLLDEVYEPFYERYKNDFGKTFAGFFSDEPELGNCPGYPFDMTLGTKDVKLPWSAGLYELLSEEWKEELPKNLTALWYGMGEQTGKIRYTYMDALTKLVQTCFSGQIGGWCRERGVEYIGHIIEDDNAHSRMGCSIGHYFREMRGQDMAGIDVVHHQIVPGFTEKIHQWIAGDCDGEFFHFGLAKLAASEARLDAKKKGRALCEIFGNYGWAEGVTFMKWLANHMLVRGINHFTPHAFSMQYPDPDCPPHFYAGGNNPQFACFARLMKYMNRVSHYLSGGSSEADIAVLYHGEAEWTGEPCMFFQKPVRNLMEHQMDCDVVTLDYLKEAGFENGKVRIGERRYAVLVIPCTRVLLEDLDMFCTRACHAGFPLVFVEGYPKIYPDGSAVGQSFWNAGRCVPLSDTAAVCRNYSRQSIRVSGYFKDLRLLTVKHSDGMAVMFFNESVAEKVHTKVYFDREEGSNWKGYYDVDAWSGEFTGTKLTGNEMELLLAPGEAKLLLLTEAELPAEHSSPVWEKKKEEVLYTDWDVTARSHDAGIPPRQYHFSAKEGLCNMNGPGKEVNFSGIFEYRTEITVKKEDGKRYVFTIPAAGDSAEIRINGQSAGHYAGFPVSVPVTDLLISGKNNIEVLAANTLVWEIKDGASTHLQLNPTGLLAQPVLEVMEVKIENEK